MSRVSQALFARAIALKNLTSKPLKHQRSFTSMTFKDPRTFHTSSVMYQPRSLAKMKKLQQDFQCEDGRPIWLKSGFCDRVLYSSTIIGCYLGVLMVLSTVYDHAKPESWKKARTC